MTNSSGKLAICTPHIGVLSETFIKRHIQDLWPGRTVVIANTLDPRHHAWRVDCPILALDQIQRGTLTKVSNALARILGINEPIDVVFSAVKHFCKQHNVQLMLGEYLSDSFFYFQYARKLKIPYFAHGHGYDLSADLQSPRWQKDYLQYHQAAGIISVNNESKYRLIQLGLPAEKIHVIPCGIAVPEFLPQREPDKHIRCIAVGRMVSKKAPIFLLDAFRRALELFPHMHLDYVGTGELFSAAWQFVQTFQLAENVTLHGGLHHERVMRLMQQADIFLQHSITDPETGDAEGLPVAVLEAMGHALPVIATSHAGIAEAVLDRETGYLVPEGDTRSMSQKLLHLAQNIDTRTGMGKKGRERCKALYSWEYEKQRLLDIMGLM